MKRILLAVILSSLVALAACGQATTPAPTPTELPATPTQPVEPTPAPTVDSAVEAEGAEPGGVDVALSLVVIPEQDVIAVINGEEISTAAYAEDLTQALYATSMQYMVDWNDTENQALLPALQQQVLEQTIDRALLRQLAHQEEVVADTEALEAEVTELKAQIEASDTVADWSSFLAENGLSEESVRRLIADSLLAEGLTDLQGGSRVVEQVRASHILVETEETGQEVLDKMAEGEPFAALAAEYSIDPGSKTSGGDLGWFPRGQMVPEFEAAAFSLEPGETSDLVKSDFGYHIIRVVSREERELNPDLYAQMQQQEFQAWFEDQYTQAEIERLYDFQTTD